MLKNKTRRAIIAGPAVPAVLPNTPVTATVKGSDVNVMVDYLVKYFGK